MTPKEKAEFEDMKRRLAAMESASNIAFISNLKRLALNEVVTSDATGGVGSLGASVRNSADTGSTTVAKAYDKSVRLYLLNGQVITVGGYN